MDINPLNHGLLALSSDPATPGAAEITGGDAFTKMMAQLGLAPEMASAGPASPAAAERGMEPVIAGMARTASILPKLEASGPTTIDAEETEAPNDEVALPAADLPPLLAALIAPMVRPAETAAPVPVGRSDIASASSKAAAPQPIAVALQGRAAANAPAIEVGVPIDPTPAALLQAVHPRFARGGAGVGLPQRSAAATDMIAAAEPALAAPKPAVEVLTALAGAPAAPSEAVTATQAADAPVMVEPLIEQQLDLASDGEWLDQLAKDIARTAGGDGNLRFRLNPEHLGSLHVELTQGSAGTSVRLTADTEATRAILTEAQPRLIAEARAQGVRIAETHVDLGGQSQSSAGGERRDGHDLPPREYLTSWKPESGEETPTPRRSSSERYA